MVGDLEVTFANVWVAAKWAVMLWPTGIEVPSKFEQTRWVPLGAVGHYLREEVLEPFRLCTCRLALFVNLGDEPVRTSRIVEM
jgi:hypothetical protein